MPAGEDGKHAGFPRLLWLAENGATDGIQLPGKARTLAHRWMAQEKPTLRGRNSHGARVGACFRLSSLTENFRNPQNAPNPPRKLLAFAGSFGTILGPTMANMVITIDGPAGSGKTTCARELADRLGFAYLDTGAT